MTRRARIAWAAAAAAAVGLSAAVIASSFRAGGDVTAFVPQDEDDDRVAISRALVKSGLGKGMIVLISGPSEGVAETTAALAVALAAHDGFDWVQTGVAKDTQSALRDVFFPARFGFLRFEQGELERLLSESGLEAAAMRLKEVLVSPLGVSIRNTVGSDPLLAFHGIVTRVGRARPSSLEIEAGAFVTTAEPKRGVIFISTNASPFAASAQRENLDVITSAASELGGDYSVEYSGVNVLAVDGEASTRADVKRISTFSIIGTIVLFIVAFRRLRYLVALVIPIGFGVVGGLAATLLAFGEVHGMTLAFGATLIGVCVDYVIHFVSHHVLGAEREPRATLTLVWPGIALGGATTIVGFVGMGLTSTVGMQQIAVFGAVGIGFALLATYAVLPFVVASRRRNTSLSRVREAIGASFRMLGEHRKPIAFLCAVAVIGSAISLPTLEWEDDPRSLATVNDELTETDEKVRAAVSTADSGRFVVARGSDWESALRVNDVVSSELEAAAAAGELNGFRSLHQLLWSGEAQTRNIEALWSRPDLGERIRAAMTKQGFRGEAFDEVVELLSGPRPAIVSAQQVIDGPLLPLLRGFYVVAEGGEVLILTQLIGVKDKAALAARFGDIDHATFFDQSDFLQSSYGGFRRRVLQVVVFGLVAVLVLVLIRYRDIRLALAAFVPALIAAGSALAILGLLGVTLNLLHVLGLMLVLSIGVDYGVFVVEASRGGDEVAVAILGTAVSCATTILGFGLLAMSDNPAMRALGSVTALGCLVSLVMAPAALALLRGNQQ